VAANAGGRIAREFHDLTAHTPYSVRTSGHTLDWDLRPAPFKVYPEAPAVPLPRPVDAPAADVLAALGGVGLLPAARLTLAELAALLFFTAGVTKRKASGHGEDIVFRAAPSTGALYQTEVYVVAGAVEGLDPGLYHFAPGDFVLRRLRSGDVRAALARAAVDPALAHRAATIVLSAIAWRNTWKYRARGYRHFWWDSGTMLAHLLAVATAQSLDPRLLTGFVDDAVSALLGLDAVREFVLEVVAIGPEAGMAPPVERLPALGLATVPLSAAEVDYPELREVHAATTLGNAVAVEAWRRRPPPPPREPRGAVTPLPRPRHAAGRPLGETIERRGSTRRFSPAPLTLLELATVLFWTGREIAMDVPTGLVDVYLIAHAVDGLEPGAYCYWRERHGLELVQPGAFRAESGYLCLEQALGAEAAAVLYFLAPLDAILRSFGDRGYRLANLEAGLAGGRAYLAAYGQRFGASGLTFYDREVVRFFSPHAEGLDAIFVTALGRSGKPLMP
jgi:SagB-type dehydrogenase family enzyme